MIMVANLLANIEREIENHDAREAFKLLCDDLNVVFLSIDRTPRIGETVYGVFDRNSGVKIGEYSIFDEERIRNCIYPLEIIHFKKLQALYRSSKELFTNVYERSSLL